MNKTIKQFLVVALGMLLLVVSGCDDDVDPQEHDVIIKAVYAVPAADAAVIEGDVPVDDNTYQLGDEITVLGNTGNLSKPGAVFSGWTTPAPGSTVVNAGSKVTIPTKHPSSSYTFTVRWAYKVSYDGNGSDGGTVPVDNNEYLAGATVTVAGAGTLTRTGYTFAGWNTAANGSGTNRAAGSTFAIGSAGVVLYARWTAAI